MRQRGTPLLRGFGMSGLLDVPQREIQELGRRLVVREVPPGLERLAELAVQALVGIRRVDDPTHGERIREGRRDALEVPLPERRALGLRDPQAEEILHPARLHA